MYTSPTGKILIYDFSYIQQNFHIRLTVCTGFFFSLIAFINTLMHTRNTKEKKPKQFRSGDKHL